MLVPELDLKIPYQHKWSVCSAQRHASDETDIILCCAYAMYSDVTQCDGTDRNTEAVVQRTENSFEGGVRRAELCQNEGKLWLEWNVLEEWVQSVRWAACPTIQCVRHT